MIKNLLFTSLLIGLFFTTNLNAAVHNIGIDGFTYTPDVIEATVGDTVNFTITATHPTVQVSEATWNSNGIAPVADGFGTKTSSFTLILTADMAPTVYYVCSSHVGLGMKGVINIIFLGIADLTNSIDFEIGPNPVVNQQLTYAIGIPNFEGARLNIYNIQGQKVFTTSITDPEGTLALDLEPGNYFIQLVNKEDGEIAIEKIILQ